MHLSYTGYYAAFVMRKRGFDSFQVLQEDITKVHIVNQHIEGKDYWPLAMNVIEFNTGVYVENSFTGDVTAYRTFEDFEKTLTPDMRITRVYLGLS